MRSDAVHRAIKGPIGSGKSAGCTVEVFRRCLQMPVWNKGKRSSRWAIVRNTMKELRNTTLKTWMDWMGTELGTWHESKFMYHLNFGDVDAEVLFLPLDTPGDVGRLLSLELTGAWVNEAREVPVSLMSDIKGRLARYPKYQACPENFPGPWYEPPAKVEGDDRKLWYWSGLLCDTNPPEMDSDWFKLFEKLPQEEGNEGSIIECDTFHQPSGLSPEAENIKNLSPGYYAAKATGAKKAWIDTYIHGKYSPSLRGKPVYHETFHRDRHVSPVPLKIDPLLPVIVGQDWGLTPAGLWIQMQHNGQIFILRETPAFDMGTKRYIRTKFKPMHMTTFPLNPIVVIGDPAGTRRADSDEGTCFKMFKDEGYIAKPAHTNDPDVRIKVFDTLFSEYPDMQPRIVIDPSCKRFIQGVSSQYRYPRKRTSLGEEYGDRPEKNDFGHLVEGGQYGALFLTGGRYDPNDYSVEHDFNPHSFTTPYRPALKEGY
jgi:hypothetical protein